MTVGEVLLDSMASSRADERVMMLFLVYLFARPMVGANY